jgi:hypothetical protein
MTGNGMDRLLPPTELACEGEHGEQEKQR